MPFLKSAIRNPQSAIGAVRRGFTLIELLMVVGIIVLLAVILVPATLRFQERSQVATGIAALQGYIAQAKARAIAEKRPYGIRLLAMRPEDRTVPGTGLILPWYDRVEFIEQPTNYNEGFIWAVLPKGGPHVIRVPTWKNNDMGVTTHVGIDPPSEIIGYQILPAFQVANRVYAPWWSLNGVTAVTGTMGFGSPPLPALLPNRKQFIQFDWAGVSDITQPMAMHVMAGDHIEINGIGQPYRIIGVTRQSTTPLGLNVPGFLTLDRDLPHDIPMPLNGRPNYRIIRQPRTVPNLPTVKLPGEVIVDLLPPSNLATLNVATDTDTTQQIWMRGVSQGIDTSFPGYGGGFPARPLPTGAPAGSQNFTPRAIELMFNDAGQLLPNYRRFSKPSNVTVPANQNQYYESYEILGGGVVNLWVHPAGAPGAWIGRSPSAAQGDADNQALISINARTGAISAYPVSLNSANPWESAQQGRAEGVGGF